MKKFIIVKTENQNLFITDNIEGKSYFNTEMSKIKFDNELLVKSFRDSWYKLSKIPLKVSIQEPQQYTNKRYELKAGYPISELTPKIIRYEEMDEDDEIKGLYTYTYDMIEGKWVDIEFEYELIEQNKFFEGKPKYSYSNYLIEELTNHPLTLIDKPCFISGKELYKIIREYIKQNINGQYARITSDYDFCLTIQKVIKLAEAQSYKVDIGTKRKPNLVTKYNKEKKVIVFQSSPEGYSSYPVQEGLSASNYEELEQKIQNYLKSLIAEINKPLEECIYCKGSGVQLTNEIVK